MALVAGETVSYETRDGKVWIYRSLDGKKVDLNSAGQADLATAKTEATTVVGNRKTDAENAKTTYNGRISALAGVATRTHADTNTFGESCTINEYDIEEGGVTRTFYIPSTGVAREDANYDEWIANLDLARVHCDDLVTAIAALV